MSLTLRAAFPDAEVIGYETLIDGMTKDSRQNNVGFLVRVIYRL